MAKPSKFELELIKKITSAVTKLEALKRKHSVTCSAEDILDEGMCTCGADEYNAELESILSDLKIN